MTAEPAATDAVTARVELRGVGVSYGAEPVLQGIDLDVAEGEVHALIGPNGGGKTTLLRAVLGQVAFTGSVRLHWRGSGRIGYVPQTLPLDDTLPLSVDDLMTLSLDRRVVWAGASARARRDGRTALAELGVDGLGGRRIADLSGGERRRVLIAQALVPEPELVVLDEPTAGVDRAAGRVVEKRIAQLRSDGVTTLLVTHDFGLARRVADRISCIHRTVRASGDPETILTADTLLETFGAAVEVERA